jgi:dsRNA-specific ribonuclease
MPTIKNNRFGKLSQEICVIIFEDGSESAGRVLKNLHDAYMSEANSGRQKKDYRPKLVTL